MTRLDYQLWLDTITNSASIVQASACEGWHVNFEPDVECMASPSVCQGSGCDRHPVVCVDWCDAYAYCHAAGKRLCGKIGGGSSGFWKFEEADQNQWYAACSSDGHHIYPYGNEYLETACNSSGLAVNSTVEVGSLPDCQTITDRGPGGIYDMSGNAWEWEDSCELIDGVVECRVRGGSFQYGGAYVSCGDGISSLAMDLPLERVGFRCCSRE